MRFSGTLSGPSPFTLAGEVCIEILFFDICGSGSFTIGEGDGPEPVETIPSLRQALEPELSKPENLLAVDGDDRLVTAKPQQTQNNKTVLSPIGKLQWAQKRAPLDTLIERFESAPLASAEAVVVASPSAAGESVQEWFSPGAFTNLSESEQLNRAAFERLQAGLVLGFDKKTAAPVAENIEYVNYVLPQVSSFALVLLAKFPSLVIESACGRHAAAGQFARSAAAIKVKDEGWTLHAAGGGQTAGLSQTDAHQRARYQGATALPDDDVIDLEASDGRNACFPGLGTLGYLRPGSGATRSGCPAGRQCISRAPRPRRRGRLSWSRAVPDHGPGRRDCTQRRRRGACLPCAAHR